MNDGHMKHLGDICRKDVATLIEKEKSYKGSWKKRGGVGAYMMLARKWDRLEAFCETHKDKWDLFTAAEADTREEPLLEDIGDLRRYLMLVEAELIERKSKPKFKIKLDTEGLTAHLEKVRSDLGRLRVPYATDIHEPLPRATCKDGEGLIKETIAQGEKIMREVREAPCTCGCQDKKRTVREQSYFNNVEEDDDNESTTG